MKIGHEHRPERVGATAVRRLGEAAGIGVAQLRARVRALAAKAPNIAEDLAHAAGEGIDAELAERIAKVVNRRSIDLHRQL